MKAKFEEKPTNVCIAQYENGTRVSKEPLLNALAETFEISSQAINITNAEDIQSLKIDKVDGEFCLRLSKIGTSYTTMFDIFTAQNTV